MAEQNRGGWVSAQWVLNGLLAVLTALMGYTITTMDSRIDLKADKAIVEMMCKSLDAKADVSDLERESKGLQLQISNMTEELRGWRTDMNKYFMERRR